MRSPFESEGQKYDDSHAGTLRRDPSFVDRRRLDSDVRAFLRQPSTPWVVFDRDSRLPPAELAPGAVLTSAAPSVLTGFSNGGFFPPSQPFAPPQDGSTAAMVSEVAGAGHEDRPALPSVAARDLRSRVLAMALGTGIGLLVFGGGAAVMLATHGAPAPPARASAATTAESALDVPPPDLDPKPANESAAPASAPTSPAPRAAVASVDTSKGKFGRLSITAGARTKQVYLDGKRLLGTGVRSFTVLCGPHTIAVGTKADAKELDVPCGGELVVSQ
jgi:hypothetical protein